MQKLFDRVVSNPYVLISPVLVLVLMFSIFPLGFVFVVSFMKWDQVTGVRDFVGFANYTAILRNDGFRQVAFNTAVFTVASVGVVLVLAVCLALFLNRKKPVYEFTQGIVFTPHIISFVSVSVMWLWLLDPRIGLVNQLLERLGFEPLLWMKGYHTALLAVTVVYVWKWLGFYTLLILAGLQAIPKYIFESAELDHAGTFTKFFYITLPLLSPTLLFVFIVAIIKSFTAFDIVYLMSRGGPDHASDILVHWIYMTGFKFFRMGQAMAGSVLFLVAVGLVYFVNYKWFSKYVHYQ